MTQSHYKVVFQGEVDTARDVEEVKHNLGVLFKASGDKIDRLFVKRTVIARDVDHQVAMTYKSALQKAGAICHVEPLVESEPSDVRLNVQQSPARRTHHYAASVVPFLPQISTAFLYPLRGNGKYILAGGALVTLLVAWVSLLLGLLTGAYIGAYMMKIVSESADGEDELPEWLELEFWADEIALPYAFMLGVMISSYLPALVYTRQASYIMSPNYVWLGALIVVGSIYAPMGLATTSVLKNPRAVNPLLIIQSIAKIPRDYAIVCGLFAIAMSISFVNMWAWLPTPWIGALLGNLLGFYLLLVSMRLLGLLCRCHEARLGWFDF
jgi:hypothetical protein